MEFKHTSVLYEETIAFLNIKPEGVYVDGTLGGGGHGAGICERLNENGIFIGIDRDKDAIEAAKERLKAYPCKKYFVQDNYEAIEDILKFPDLNGSVSEVNSAVADSASGAGLSSLGIDGAVLDLGVSSFQLDNAERGFSYMQNAPLDMRMSREDSLTAEMVVNTYSKEALTKVIQNYGEEKWASRIASFIVKGREEHTIKDTGELVELIKQAIPASARREGPHPAKRTFQAIRIEVNDELGQLKRAMDAFPKVLNRGGRLCVITFHSLEDRIVKDKFKEKMNPCTCPKEFPLCICGKTPEIKKVTGKPVTAGKEELEENPRARSAKLRVIEKI